MNIVMLITQTGSRDGILAEQFRAGQHYDLTATAGERDLAAVFVREDWAREVAKESTGEVAEAAKAAEGAEGAEVAQTESGGRRKRSAAK